MATAVVVMAIFLRPPLSARAAEVNAAPIDSERMFHDHVVPFLARNCYECHGNGNHLGNVSLDSISSATDIQSRPALWKSILRALQGAVMPRSASKEYPTFSERNAIADWIQKELYLYTTAHPDPGVAAIHRLSRVEYRNTVRDLLGVDFKPGDDFPADESGKVVFLGAADRSLTPELKQKYFDAALQVMDQATIPETDQSPASARAILGNFARRAWRRPVEPAELDRLLSLFAAAEQNGASFQAAIKSSMKTSLVSPDFLFRGRLTPDAGVAESSHPVSEYELASRLSYFLWSTLPDDELLNLAEHHELRSQLPDQVKRMLASPRAGQLVENFSEQWFQLSYLDMAKPNKNLDPEFDNDLRESMRKETQLFFNAVMRDDRSVMDFLNGDYTFVNQGLAELYGIPGVQGDQFRRVSLEGTPRRGVATQAAILTSTIYGPRVSIAKRGRWVMTTLLNLPGDTPRIPAPLLPEVNHPGSGPLRKQLEQHRSDAQCEYCHVQIDPLGFGLENFDPIGKWRDQEGGEPVDATGQLPTGESFNGAVQMLNILAEKHRDQFLQSIATKMLGYAIGRRVTAADQPAVDEIVAGMRKNDLKFSSLVQGVVDSMPFQMQRGETLPAAK
jgi:hypothetical protein